MPDFYIGAHAAIAGFTLLTRDARRYKTYFPSLQHHRAVGVLGPLLLTFDRNKTRLPLV